MKKNLNLIAIIFCVIALIGYAFKLLHWPYAGAILVISTAVFLALLIYWFVVSAKSVFNIVLFLFGLIFLIGHILKGQQWPGGQFIYALTPAISIILITTALVKKE